MKRKVYTDGNGGTRVLIDGLGVYVPQPELYELKAQVEKLKNELTLSTDQNDLLLDEFVRVKLLTDNEEIHGLCERAHVRMRQKVSVIDRNFKQAKEIKQLKSQVEVLREVANDAIHFAIKRNDKVCADPMFVMQQLQNRLDATPAQCLAEIKAQAVETEYKDLLHVVANQYDGNDSSEWSIGANHVFRLFTKEVTKRANQLRQQAKAGE